jgi:hypothetical protein
MLQQSLNYTSSPLTDDQSNQLIQLLAQNAPRGNRFDVNNSGPLVSNESAQITAQEIAQAVLSDLQVQALKQLQESSERRNKCSSYYRKCARFWWLHRG